MIISEIELFKGIDFEVINKIADNCSEVSYSKGTVLFKNNEKAKCLYILITGTVNLVIQNGGSITYSLTEHGEVFGWSSMFESVNYTASAVCATDSTVVEIQKDKINKIFQAHPAAGLKVLMRMGRVFSSRLSNAYSDLLSATAHDSTASYG